jgi:hypothetical protein
MFLTFFCHKRRFFLSFFFLSDMRNVFIFYFITESIERCATDLFRRLSVYHSQSIKEFIFVGNGKKIKSVILTFNDSF